MELGGVTYHGSLGYPIHGSLESPMHGSIEGPMHGGPSATYRGSFFSPVKASGYKGRRSGVGSDFGGVVSAMMGWVPEPCMG